MSLESEINKDIIHKLEQELGMYKCMEGKYRDMKTQRDTLIDDIAVLRANNERLERENEKQLELLKKFSGFINFKLWVSPTSDTYKNYRSELNKLGVK